MKDFLNTKFGFVLMNLGIAVVVGIILIFVVFGWLKHYTQHGVEVEVPNIVGLQKMEAEQCLADSGLKIVIIDSTFSNNVPLGTIVEQNPPVGSHAKKDRSVYVIINSSFHRQVEIPDLHDISYRQAQTTLQAIGLRIGRVLYEPSEYRDIVLELRHEGEPLNAGDRLDEGSEVTMVVGKGKGTEKVKVPSLQGKTLAEVRALLIEHYHLTVGLVRYDETPAPDKIEEYIIYQQSPTPGTSVVEGTGIDVNLTLDVEKAITQTVEEPEEDDFF